MELVDNVTIMHKQNDNVNQSRPDTLRDDDVLELVHSVMHRYRSQQYQALRDGAHDVTHMESKVLGYFGHHPGATQSELAEHSGRDKAQLARLIKGLRERGLLDAVVGEADRRSVKLSLTDEGQAVLRSLQQQGRRLNKKATAGMSAAEAQQLIALLQRVRGNLGSVD
jgi:DNA-binding MarR family transcriptional regulator